MSVKSDAETIQDLAGKIVNFEILKLQFQANGGAVEVIPGDSDSRVPLSGAQRTTLLALEDGWWTTIKTLAASH